MLKVENANWKPFQTVSSEEVDSQIEEQRLLERVSHDPTAFWPLWRRHEPYLKRCCLKWMGNQQDAEDILSEVMLKAQAVLPSRAEQISNLQAWLTRLSQNVCHDLYRKRTRESTFLEQQKRIIVNSGDAHLSAERAWLNEEMHQQVCGAIAGLPTGMREVAILFFLQQKSTAEIAAHLTISPRLVRQRIQRARPLLSHSVTRYLMDNQGSNQGRNEKAFEKTLVVERAVKEIEVQVVTIPAIQVTLPTGVQRCFYFPLRRKPVRLEQRRRALQDYVERYPTGILKRLELAELFVAMGDWENAIEAYREIMIIRPEKILVYLQLGKILHLTERINEAISVYEQALSVAKQPATQHHLRGLIDSLLRRPESAISQFEAAIDKDPGNGAHWHALGMSQLGAGYLV